VPTAWDYKFGQSSAQWMLIVLKDGTKFAGFFGDGSFASSCLKNRDIFLQQVFEIDDNENWTPSRRSLLVAAGEIRTIEFWPLDVDAGQEEKGSNGEQQQATTSAAGTPAPVRRLSAAAGAC
jgi:Family of unknown function (DUF6338)